MCLVMDIETSRALFFIKVAGIHTAQNIVSATFSLSLSPCYRLASALIRSCADPEDVIGFLICLPKLENPVIEEPLPVYPFFPPKLDTKEPPIHQDSKIIFFRNGISQGVAFSDIYQGLLSVNCTDSSNK